MIGRLHASESQGHGRPTEVQAYELDDLHSPLSFAVSLDAHTHNFTIANCPSEPLSLRHSISASISPIPTYVGYLLLLRTVHQSHGRLLICLDNTAARMTIPSCLSRTLGESANT